MKNKENLKKNYYERKALNVGNLRHISKLYI